MYGLSAVLIQLCVHCFIGHYYEALMNYRLEHNLGETVADCELCGAMKVGTRTVIMGKAEVQACKRCSDKMGLAEKKVHQVSKNAKQLQSNIRWLWRNWQKRKRYHASR